jgi:gamma-glutamylcyclotransferase (GGCT)/AIG2-like uncharacterized protein YtfP
VLVPHLFSYGTLQLRDVQLANFGRELAGQPDALPGYRRELIEITDPSVVSISGSAQHPIVVPGDSSDSVPGTVFEITDAELAAADEYEVDDYARVAVRLRSGTEAWVYVAIRR